MRRTIIVSNSMSYFRTQRFYRLRLGDIRRYIYIYIYGCVRKGGEFLDGRLVDKWLRERDRGCQGCEGVVVRGVLKGLDVEVWFVG